MKTVRSVKEAIEAVEAGAVGVCKDTYPNNPEYHILENTEELTRFKELVHNLEIAPRGTMDVYRALKALEDFVGQGCLDDHLHFIYEDGKWVYDPQLILQEEEEQKMQDEDDEWFARQREHFSQLREY